MPDVTPSVIVPATADPAFDADGVAAFWRDAVATDGAFISRVDGLRLRYASAVGGSDAPALVIASGRTEAFIKYQEIVRDFAVLGYAVYIYDHRGQGLSGRLLDDPQVGHVTDFRHYVDDLAQFVEEIVIAAGHARVLLLGHSMGGTTVAAYLTGMAGAVPDAVAGAALSAPMFGIRGDNRLTRAFLKVLRVARRSARPPPFMNYRYDEAAARKVADDEPCTRSVPRKRYIADQFAALPEARLGAPSAHWIDQAFAVCRALQARAAAVKVPLLVVSAGADPVVDNAAQHTFCNLANANRDPLCRLVTVAGGLHELLMEADPYRDEALRHITAFFETLD